METLRYFLSRQNDIYRASFGKRTTSHPRQCVFFGTTNAERGYLRDTIGNRRFWPVKMLGGCGKCSWDATFMKGNGPIDMRLLKGRDCYAGLDLSSAGDITALALIFPPRDTDEKYIIVRYFWIPEETLPQRVKDNSVPYDVWEKQGFLMATEGNVIHYDFIEKFICDWGEKYHILEIAVDRWNATQMIQNLEGDGFTMVPFGQGFASMSIPTKEFYRLLMEDQILHAGYATYVCGGYLDSGYSKCFRHSIRYPLVEEVVLAATKVQLNFALKQEQLVRQMRGSVKEISMLDK